MRIVRSESEKTEDKEGGREVIDGEGVGGREFEEK